MTPEDQPKAANPRPVLRPPDAGSPHTTGKAGNSRLVWGALVIVILLGLAVLLLLPKVVTEPADKNTAETPGPTADTATEAAPQEPETSRADAATALQDVLHTQARLELANAPIWGEPEWSEAIESAARGNDLFGQRQFSSAYDAFAKSLELLLLLESESGQRLGAALDAGWQALQIDDSAAAVTFFETAMAIDTENENALEGLERSRVRPDLLRLMAEGELAHSTDELPVAQAAYMQAVELDRLYEPAQTALEDVTRQIIDLAFNDAMSRALSSLESGQVKPAEQALRQAASLKPNEEVVRNTQQQLAQLKQKLWLKSQRKEAAAKESGEDWSAAVAIYRKVLATVPQAGFARRGLAKAEDRERLHQQLDHYLNDPTRVFSEQPRTNAEKLIRSAGKPPAEEKRLDGKIERLQAMIIEAQTPQTVTLRSDGLTNVAIYHVGRLGSFLSQQLELPPGSYTVVGSRPGYRDVRQTFTVKPGSEQPALDIRCEETI